MLLCATTSYSPNSSRQQKRHQGNRKQRKTNGEDMVYKNQVECDTCDRNNLDHRISYGSELLDPLRQNKRRYLQARRKTSCSDFTTDATNNATWSTNSKHLLTTRITEENERVSHWSYTTEKIKSTGYKRIHIPSCC